MKFDRIASSSDMQSEEEKFEEDLEGALVVSERNNVNVPRA